MKVADANQAARGEVPAFKSRSDASFSSGQAQVHPLESMIKSSKPHLPRRRRVTKAQVAVAVFNWLLWLFVAFLVLSQCLGLFSGTMSEDVVIAQGQSPVKGPGPIAGFNDEPYSGRSVVCTLQGRSFLPLSVNDAIALKSTKVADTTGSSVNGYRVGKRAVNTISSDANAVYAHTCSVIASTLDALFERCTLLGYNVTRDVLRVVDDLNSSTTYVISNSLPVLMMPYWDNCLIGRFAIPGSDGSACMFRLVGEYSDPTSAVPYLIAVNRVVRESKTVEWLNRPGGAWRNGWYEDLEGEKWHSDVISDEKDSPLGIPLTQFNMLTGEPMICKDPTKCAAVFLDSWGAKFSYGSSVLSRTSIIISNGKRYGMFQYKAHLRTTTNIVYDWETLVFNVVAARILLRWFLAMATLQRGYFQGSSDWHNAGIGCLANYRSFDYLPVLLLPRLKMTLFAFWTTGCQFRGPQHAFAQAWFVMYPSIVQVVLLYYSLLNLLAKLARRRVSDVLFGPTILFFCALHWSRMALATSGWLDVTGDVPGLVTVGEFNSATLLDFFTSNLALRTSGNRQTILVIKLVAFGISLLPFLWNVVFGAKHDGPIEPMSRIEKAIAVRIRNTGGLGRAQQLATTPSSARATEKEETLRVLDSYEMVRLGYLVFGDSTTASKRSYMISFDDWDLLTLLTPVRSFTHLWNHRVKVFAIEMKHRIAMVAKQPENFHIDDPRLQRIPWWQISSRPESVERLDRFRIPMNDVVTAVCGHPSQNLVIVGGESMRLQVVDMLPATDPVAAS